ncbi:hypothetical protein LPJGGPFB_05051 [Ensifer adhaerens]|nr:hypothetical protein [Ensifer adhaerens]
MTAPKMPVKITDRAVGSTFPPRPDDTAMATPAVADFVRNETRISSAKSKYLRYIALSCAINRCDTLRIRHELSTQN